MTGDSDFDDADQTITLRSAAVPARVVRLGHFLAFTQDGVARRVRIGPEGVTVGRHPACTIVFAVADVSRQHCRIQPAGDGVSVSDLGSTNGTFVGGNRIDGATPLANGSHIVVGGFLLRYEQRDERELEEAARLTTELRQAAEYVRAILPEPVTTGPVRAEWWYVPSSELGGDAFGYQFLDDTTLAGFLLDVSGHGIGAGMHAVNVSNVLRRRALPGVDFHDPSAVVAGLNVMFPMEAFGGLIFTVWYFVYDTRARMIRFCSAGHHPGFVVAPGSEEPSPLWLRSPSVGMLPPRAWPSAQAEVAPDSRIYIFSDGAFEIEQPDGEQWQLENLRQVIGRGPVAGIGESQRLYQAVRSAARPGPLADDFSVLVLHFPA